MEHIHNIEIKNFKSIRHASIDGCRRINVFVGPPNVGKSNILEALGLYSVTQQVNNERFSLHSICRYKRASDLFFNRDLHNKLAVSINGKHELSISINRNSLSEFEIYIHTNGLLERSVFSTLVRNEGNFGMFSNPTGKDGLENEIYKICIKYYQYRENSSLNAEKANTLSIPNGDNLLSILDANADLRRKYIELLAVYNLRLHISGDASVVDMGVAKELKDGTIVSFSINLMADTLRRLFFHIAAIQTNGNSILLFEEPEAHMYPPYIAKFTSDMMYDENNNQYFITTHSPFVISDIMENLKKEDYAIYTVGYDKENGETLVKRLSDEELHEIYQYGIDLFLNLENYLPDEHKQ